MKFKQNLIQMLGLRAFSLTYKLVNNTPKKIGLLVVFFFAFLASGELAVFFWEIPDFKQLTINEGKIKITNVTVRTGSIYTLHIDRNKIKFNCGIPAIYRIDCVDLKKIHYFHGQSGKVWWYRSEENWWDNNTLIYQLEVNGNIEIDYQSQKKRYLFLKKYYFYPYTIVFVISLIMFFLLQFANNTTSNK